MCYIQVKLYFYPRPVILSSAEATNPYEPSPMGFKFSYLQIKIIHKNYPNRIHLNIVLEMISCRGPSKWGEGDLQGNSCSITILRPLIYEEFIVSNGQIVVFGSRHHSSLFCLSCRWKGCNVHSCPWKYVSKMCHHNRILLCGNNSKFLQEQINI